MDTERVRVLRIIEYEGDREWVERTVRRAIKGTLIVYENPLRIIRAGTIGEFPEIIRQRVEYPDLTGYEEKDQLKQEG